MGKPEYLIRYMSLGKFMDFLETKSIYFSRIDQFEDKTEGEWFSHLSRFANAEISDWASNCFNLLEKVNTELNKIEKPSFIDIKKTIEKTLTKNEILELDISDDMSQVMDPDFFDDDYERIEFLLDVQESYTDMIESTEQKEKYLDDENKVIQDLKKRSYVSSWFSNDAHSIAMWRLYGINDESIAIRIKKEKLKSIENENEKKLQDLLAKILFADVTYIDENDVEMGPLINRNISNQEWLDFRNLLLKHNAYRYEEEYRAAVIIPENINNPKGIKLFIGEDLNDIIEEIFLNPLIHSNHWYVNIIKKILSSYNISHEKLKFVQIKTVFTK